MLEHFSLVVSAWLEIDASKSSSAAKGISALFRLVIRL
jgi:hypothetical protein